jgi:hypothetical protein
MVLEWQQKCLHYSYNLITPWKEEKDGVNPLEEGFKQRDRGLFSLTYPCAQGKKNPSPNFDG